MKLTVDFCNEQNIVPIRKSFKLVLERAIRETLASERFPYDSEVSVTFVDNEEIKRLNNEYRNKDCPTDVLSFPLYDFTDDDVVIEKNEPVALGDIVISLEQAQIQAAEIGHGVLRETVFLCIHSMLHLLGYDHELSDEDDENMQFHQKKIMERLNYGIMKC